MAGDAQSPKRMTSVGGVAIGARESTSTRRSCEAAAWRISPVASITAEMPVVVARTCGRRVSMLRNADTVRWSQVPGPSPNQASFDIVTRSSPPPAAAARACAGTTAS